MEKVSNRSKKGSLGDFLRHFEVYNLADEKYCDFFGLFFQKSRIFENIPMNLFWDRLDAFSITN